MTFKSLSLICPTLRLVLASLLGFCAADLVFVLLHAPALLRPSHWGSLSSLVISGLILYACIGLLFLGFLVLIYIISRLLCRPLSGISLAITTVLATPLFLIVQENLQAEILGTYISLKSPMFFLPTGLTLLGLILCVALVAYGRPLLTSVLSPVRRVGTFPGMLVVSGIVFLILALATSRYVDVLGIIAEEDQRSPRMERRLTEQGTTPTAAPNFIVLAIECWRSDHFNPELTPFLWRLAQDHTTFNQYHVVAPATRPSVTSFFTGIYPVQHGCYNLAFNGGPGNQQALVRVADTAQAFPGVLQRSGYRTVMITSNSLTMDPVFGFQEVFNRFSALDPYQIRVPTLQIFQAFHFLQTYLHHSRVFKVICFSPEHSTTYYDAPRVNSTVKRELERIGEDPFFMYVHYMEPHAPYYFHPYRPFQLNFYSAARKNEIVAAYRDEIQAIDLALADLFTYLQEESFLDHTYVLITADHGEEFLDHGDWGHGKHLFPETLHVPAILVQPGGPSPRVITDMVENIDIAPTFAALAGITPPEIWEGESLSPGLQGDTAGGPLQTWAFSQFYDSYVFQASVQSPRWHFILRRSGEQEKYQLFRLKDDPQCRHNLAGEGLAAEAELVSLLADRLKTWELTAALFQGEEELIDEEHMKQLRALGYVD